jgi:predicted SAM-dependent methyltransferase|tara:strand:- start:80 stop:637 length:558 start_codon:yes stop_codon:yes gene_type:complete
MKLHLGCGPVNIPGFYNIDLSDHPHIHLKADIKKLPMFENESVELIYVSAVFQYFDRQEGLECLEEWYRILKKGGVLRISTVDFDKLIEVYKKTNTNLSYIIGPLYGKMNVFDSQGQPIEKIYHKTVYNRDEMALILKQCGYTKIENYNWKEHIHNNYDDQSQSYFPHMQKENGIHIMQNLQAIK